MTRWVGRVLGLLVLAGLVLFPAVLWGNGGDGPPDDATITNYDAEFDVSDSGRLSATETLQVSFPAPSTAYSASSTCVTAATPT